MDAATFLAGRPGGELEETICYVLSRSSAGTISWAIPLDGHIVGCYGISGSGQCSFALGAPAPSIPSNQASPRLFEFNNVGGNQFINLRIRVRAGDTWFYTSTAASSILMALSVPSA